MVDLPLLAAGEVRQHVNSNVCLVFEVVIVDVQAVVEILETLRGHLVADDTHDLPGLLVPRSVLQLKPDGEPIVIHGRNLRVSLTSSVV